MLRLKFRCVYRTFYVYVSFIQIGIGIEIGQLSKVINNSVCCYYTLLSWYKYKYKFLMVFVGCSYAIIIPQ